MHEIHIIDERAFILMVILSSIINMSVNKVRRNVCTDMWFVDVLRRQLTLKFFYEEF